MGVQLQVGHLNLLVDAQRAPVSSYDRIDLRQKVLNSNKLFCIQEVQPFFPHCAQINLVQQGMERAPVPGNDLCQFFQNLDDFSWLF